MRWYWAILLTIAILALAYPTAVVGNDEQLTGVVFVLTGTSAIWVAANSGSFRWGFLVFVLFPLFFPWYWIRSGIKKRESERRAQFLEPHEPE